MPHRILRSSILDSDAVNRLDAPQEVFYRRLMSVVDDFGRFDGRASVLRAACFPLRIDSVRDEQVTEWCDACAAAGLVLLYSIDQKPFLLLHKLGSPRAKASRFPAPPDDACAHVKSSARTCAQTRADARARTCAQTRADVTYSYSYSGSKNPLPRRAGDKRCAGGTNGKTHQRRNPIIHALNAIGETVRGRALPKRLLPEHVHRLAKAGKLATVAGYPVTGHDKFSNSFVRLKTTDGRTVDVPAAQLTPDQIEVKP